METNKVPAPGSGSGAHVMPSSVLLSRRDIEQRIYELAHEIDEHYRMQEFTMLVVMDGAMIFAADLSRRLRGPHKIESTKIKSYAQGKIGAALKITQEMPQHASKILIVEDIVDSGRTMIYLMNRYMNADTEVRVVSLVERRDHDPCADWIGFRIGPGFIYGYGLDDERGLGRGLKDIWVRGVDLGVTR